MRYLVVTRSNTILLRMLMLAPLVVAPRFALAHHSGLMFDPKQQITLLGTVREFQWTNPHCWIQLDVSGPKGLEEWSIEMAAPAEVFRGGWRPKTLKAGDRIRVTMHPSRDGARAGLFMSAAGPSGNPLGAGRR